MKIFGTFLGLIVCGVGGANHALGQCKPLANSIWSGTLTGTTKEVAHYQRNVKGPSVTGATANAIPAEIWFPSETTFCVVFNNRIIRASSPDGRNGILVYDGNLYDVVVGQNPCPSNPMLTYWRGTGTVDKKKKTLKATSKTEADPSPDLTTEATYVYGKVGKRDTLQITGTALLPAQGLDSHGDGWKLKPGVVTFRGTFTQTTNKVSIEGPKQGILGF